MDTQIIVEGRRRPVWPIDVKRAIVAETLEPDVSVVDVARRHELDPAQVYQWRKALRPGCSGFLPVELDDVCADEPIAVASAPTADRLELILINGRRLIVSAQIDANKLACLAKVLKR